MSSQPYKRIEKTTLKRLQDCEAHVHFLENAMHDFEYNNSIYYKQIVAELRVLVADNSKNNNGLLIDFLDDIGLEYKFDYDGKKVSIKEFLSSFGACLNMKNFSKAALIREIAQNEGSSHEPKSLPESLVIAHSFQINGLPVHILQIIQDAKYILGASKEIITYFKNNFDYKPLFLDL